jgi:hypothetical protein
VRAPYICLSCCGDGCKACDRRGLIYPDSESRTLVDGIKSQRRPGVEKPLCEHCARGPRWAKGLCVGCYHFKRRTGLLPSDALLSKRRPPSKTDSSDEDARLSALLLYYLNGRARLGRGRPRKTA